MSRVDRDAAPRGAGTGGPRRRKPRPQAVALRYRPADDAAPVVVAKGQGDVARRIVDRAAAAGVPVVSDPPLAAALLSTELGRAVSPQVYHLVAEVLAFVYTMNQRAGRKF